MRQRHLFLCAGLGLAFAMAGGRVPAQTPPATGTYAIVGAKIEVGDGRVIEKGTVLLRDGIIQAVGPDVKVPPDAEIIKGDGLTVYPGFIDAFSTKGVTVPEGQPNQDVPPDTSAEAPPFMREAYRKGMRPELRAADILTLTDDLLRPERQAGFTTELIVPSGGTINGIGALVNLNGLPRRDSVVRPSVAMNFTFGTVQGGYPNSLMGIMAFTRQTLLDAQYYSVLQNSFAHGGSHRPPDDPALEALQPVLSGVLPTIYNAGSEREIRRAVKMADEFHLNLILSGGLEAYKAAPLLAEKHIPVLLSLNFGQEPGVAATNFGGGGPGGGAGSGLNRPGGGGGGRRRGGANPGGAPGGGANPAGAPGGGTPAGAPGGTQRTTQTPPTTTPATPGGQIPPGGFPFNPGGVAPIPPEDENTPKAVVQERHKKWEERVANAATLSKAGVPFAFSTEGTRTQTEFMANLRRAIQAGLPREAALRALTIDAARILKVDRQLGTVEAGKVAALIVMSGDFAEPRSNVLYLFIDRAKFEPGKDIGPLIQPARRRNVYDDDGNDEADDASP